MLLCTQTQMRERVMFYVTENCKLNFKYVNVILLLHTFILLLDTFINAKL